MFGVYIKHFQVSSHVGHPGGPSSDAGMNSQDPSFAYRHGPCLEGWQMSGKVSQHHV